MKINILWKTLLFTLLIITSLLGIQVQPSFAHRPHDVIEQIAISPDYGEDQTLIIVVRGNLYKSNDGGQSWQRLVKGFNKLYRSPTPIMDLAMAQSNKNTFFATTEWNGIYKSNDGGESWVSVNNGLPSEKLGGLTTFKVHQIGISPLSTQDVVVTGREGGLYLSRNGGQTWESILDNQQLVTALAITPTNKIIMVDDKGNIIKSEDFGQQWQTISTISSKNTVNRLVISPNFSQDQTFFLVTSQEGVLRTSDGGKTFTPITQGIKDKRIQDLALSPNYPQDKTLAVVNWQDGAFISKDDGQSWQKVNKGLVKDVQADEFKVPHFYFVRFSPNIAKDNTLMVGSFNGLFQSTDGGQNWQEIETLAHGIVVAFDISPSYAQDETLALATYVGNIYHSQDQGKTWQPINKGLERPLFEYTFKPDPRTQDPRRYYDLRFSPNYNSDRIVWAGLLWSQIAKTMNGGKSWDIIKLPPPQGRGLTLAASPNFEQDQTLFVLNQKGDVFRSQNKGKKLERISKIEQTIGNDPSSIVVSPNFEQDQTLYAVGKGGIFQSTNGGRKWNLTTSEDLIGLAQGFQLAISPDYANDQTVVFSSTLGLFMTEDGGQTWGKVAIMPDDPSPDLFGVAISPNYAQDKTIMVTARGKGLYKSVDGGQSFQPVGDRSVPIAKLDNIPYAGTPIHFSPNYAEDQTIFGLGSTTTEVFRSTDAGNTWETLTVPINDHNQYDSATRFRVRMLLYRRHLGALVGAIIAAVLAYWLIGYAQLHKRLPLNKGQLSVLGGSIVFLLTFFAVETLF
ncbi:MAG: WD40/YVTN/BNR-like repeat-containing protein [Microcystaceae cyanobacterium]